MKWPSTLHKPTYLVRPLLEGVLSVAESFEALLYTTVVVAVALRSASFAVGHVEQELVTAAESIHSATARGLVR
jgi:hypothetical protein